MKKVRIKVAIIGRIPRDINLRIISDWNSEIFEVEGACQSYPLSADSDLANWEYSDKVIKSAFPLKDDADFVIALVGVPLEDNWYVRLLDEDCFVITFHDIKDHLRANNVPLENLILRFLYVSSIIYLRGKSETLGNFDITHDETRGCLFDFNGIKYDLAESCYDPIICDDCQVRMRKDKVSNEVIETAKSEIKRIRKTRYFRWIDYIQAHPVRSLILSAIAAIILGAIGSLIASFIYDVIKPKTSVESHHKLQEQLTP